MSEQPIPNPDHLRVHPIEEPIKRAWLMVRVDAGDPVQIAVQIIDGINGSNTFRNIIEAFAIRADIVEVSGETAGFHIMVPVNASFESQIDEMIGIIQGIDGVISVAKALVVQHIPEKPIDADGFISYQEENKPRGTISKEGYNAWG